MGSGQEPIVATTPSMTKTCSRACSVHLRPGDMRVTGLQVAQQTEKGTWVVCVLTHLHEYGRVVWHKPLFLCELLKLFQGLPVFLGVPPCGRGMGEQREVSTQVAKEPVPPTGALPSITGFITE